jgi:hypothetical protein
VAGSKGTLVLTEPRVAIAAQAGRASCMGLAGCGRPGRGGPSGHHHHRECPDHAPVARPPRIGPPPLRGHGVMTGRWLERNDFPGCQQEPPTARKGRTPIAVSTAAAPPSWPQP